MTVGIGTLGTEVTSNAVTSKTMSFTMPTVTNGGLICQVVSQKAATLMAAHWDSTGTNQPMTLLGSKFDTGNVATAWLFGLFAPTAGAKTLNVTWTGSSDICVQLIPFSGVDQTAGFANVTLSSGSTLAQAVSQTSATGNYAVCVWTGDGSLGTPTPNSAFVDNRPNNISAAGAYATGSTTVSFGCAGPTLPWAAVSCNIVAASGGTNTPLTLSNTVTAPAVLARQTGTKKTNTVTAVALRINQFLKTAASTIAAPAVLVRNIGKTLLNAVTAPATLAAGHVNPRSINSVIVSTGFRLNLVNKPLVQSVTVTAQATHPPTKLLTNTVAVTATRGPNVITKVLTNSVVMAGTLVRLTSRLLFNTVIAPATRSSLINFIIAKQITVPATLTEAHAVPTSISSTVTAPATLIRQAGLVRLGSSSPVSSLVRQTNALRTNTVTVVASLVRLRNETLPVTVTAPASLFRQTGELLQVTAAVPASLFRQTGELLTNTATVIATLSVLHVVLVSVTRTVTAVSSLVRQTGKPIFDALTITSIMLRQTGELLTNTVTAPASMSRAPSLSRTLAVSVTVTASLIHAAGRLLTNTVTAPAILIRQDRKTIATSTSPVALRISQTIKSAFANTVTVTALRISQTAKTAFVSASSVATTTAIKVVLNLITSTVTAQARLVRQVNLLRTNAVATPATLQRSLSRTLTATGTIGAGAAILTRLTNKTLAAASQGTASLVEGLQFGRTLTVSSSPVASLLRRTLKTLAAASSGSAVRISQINKSVNAIIVTNASVVRTFAHSIATTVSALASASAQKVATNTITATAVAQGVASLGPLVKLHLLSLVATIFGSASLTTESSVPETPAQLATIDDTGKDVDSQGVGETTVRNLLAVLDTPSGIIHCDAQSSFTGTYKITLRNRLITPRSLFSLTPTTPDGGGVPIAGTLQWGWLNQRRFQVDFYVTFNTPYTGPLTINYTVLN